MSSRTFTQGELQRLHQFATVAQLHIDNWNDSDKKLMRKIFSMYALNKQNGVQ